MTVTFEGDVWWLSAGLRRKIAKIVGVKVATLDGRLRLGWPLEDAIDPNACTRRMRAHRLAGRSLSHPLTFDGRTMLMREWARETGIARATIRERLRAGWTVAKALTTPVTKRSGNRYTAARTRRPR